MKEFLKKIKLIKDYSVVIPLDRSDCIKIFKENIDVTTTKSVFNLNEYLSSSKNTYIGQIDFNGFEIRKRKRFINFNKNSSIVKGVFRQKGEVLYMNTEVIGMSLLKTSIYILIVVFFMYFVSFTLIEKKEPIISVLTTVFIQSLILLGVPYLVLKSRIKRMQFELEENIMKWILKW